MDDFQFDDLIENDGCEQEDTTRRKLCFQCSINVATLNYLLQFRRPSPVCLCSSLPQEKILTLCTKLIILQHPHEVRRPLNTAQILKLVLSPESCEIIARKRFPVSKHPNLHKQIKDIPTLILYPSNDSVPLSQIELPVCRKINVIILDGTWLHAKALYNQNPFLHSIKKVKLEPSNLSQYIIHTQPNSECVSTLECAAVALSHFENNEMYKEEELKRFKLFYRFYTPIAKKSATNILLPRQLTEKATKLTKDFIEAPAIAMSASTGSWGSGTSPKGL